MLSKGRARQLACILAFAVSLAPIAAHAADVNVTTSTSTQISLDASVGSTVEVAPGIVVNPGFGSRAIYATIGSWGLTNRGVLSASGLATVELRVAGSSVTNYGTISTPNSNAINLFAGGTVDNKVGATISGGATASVTIVLGHSSGGPAGPGTLTNAGTISSVNSGGVILNFGGSVTNLLGGTITAAGSGSSAVTMQSGASQTVTNSGALLSTGAGFAAGITVVAADNTLTHTSTVTNTGTGQISGTYNGIYAGSDAVLALTNDGTISSTGSNAGSRTVEASAGGTITNTGTIQSASGTGVYLAKGGTVTNSGTISGAVHAIQFNNTAFTRTLKLDTGSVLTGDVLGGTAGTDNLVLLGSGTESLAKFSNFETFSMQGSAWSVTGAGTFATSAEVQAGVLNVGGNLTSPLFSILAGGTLTGTGTVTASGGISNSGTVRVAAGETLHLTGNLTNSGSSTFAVGVTPVSAGVLAVTGTASLGNGTLSVLASGGTFPTTGSYTILTAASVSGQFGTLSSSSPFLTPSVVYNPTSVVLTLDRSLVSFASAGNTPNEIATGTALDSLPGTDPLVAQLATLSLADAAMAFDQLSGEAYASAQAALANDSRYPRAAALDQVDAAFAAIDVLRAGRRNIWGRGFGGMGGINGDGNAAGVGDGTGGLLIGGDSVLPGNMGASLYGGFSTSHFSIPDRGSEIATQSFQLGLSGGRDIGPVRVKSGFIGGVAGISVDRTAHFPGFSQHETASYAEATGQLFTEISYALDAAGVRLAPFGRLALVGVSGGDYAESGGGAALSGHSDGYGLALVTLGLGGSTDLALADDLTVHAHGRIGLEQGFGGAPTATNRFAGSNSFTVAGAPAGGTTLLVEAGLTASPSPATVLSLGLNGALGTSGGSGAVTAGLSGQF